MATAADVYELLDGKIEAFDVVADPAEKPKTKLLKPISVTRTPGGRIARIDIMLKRGLVELEIDEPTARAIVKVFDDDTASNGTPIA